MVQEVNDYEINEFDERRVSHPGLDSFLSSLSYLSIENPDLRNTDLQADEPPRTHDLTAGCDFWKGASYSAV